MKRLARSQLLLGILLALSIAACTDNGSLSDFGANPITPTKPVTKLSTANIGRVNITDTKNFQILNPVAGENYSAAVDPSWAGTAVQTSTAPGSITFTFTPSRFLAFTIDQISINVSNSSGTSIGNILAAVDLVNPYLELATTALPMPFTPCRTKAVQVLIFNGVSLVPLTIPLGYTGIPNVISAVTLESGAPASVVLADGAPTASTPTWNIMPDPAVHSAVAGGSPDAKVVVTVIGPDFQGQRHEFDATLSSMSSPSCTSNPLTIAMVPAQAEHGAPYLAIAYRGGAPAPAGNFQFTVMNMGITIATVTQSSSSYAGVAPSQDTFLTARVVDLNSPTREEATGYIQVVTPGTTGGVTTYPITASATQITAGSSVQYECQSGGITVPGTLSLIPYVSSTGALLSAVAPGKFTITQTPGIAKTTFGTTAGSPPAGLAGYFLRMELSCQPSTPPGILPIPDTELLTIN